MYSHAPNRIEHTLKNILRKLSSCDKKGRLKKKRLHSSLLPTYCCSKKGEKNAHRSLRFANSLLALKCDYI